MINKNLFFLAGILLACGGSATAQSTTRFKTDKRLLRTIEGDMGLAAAQYHQMMGELKDDRFPKTWDAKTGKLETSPSGWWCSGFYPGTLLYLYEQTKDTVLYHEALRILQPLAKEQYNTRTHDLGFMMYCSFGNANRLQPSPQYRQVLLNSAKSLSGRFNPAVGCIRSWDSKPSDFLVIIDNMMNLELLFWATKETGDSSYYKIAVTHANTTLKNHFRPDYSSYHVVNYNPENGAVQQKRTAQGAADESAWARGQAWGLYGFAVMYRETGNPVYLHQAEHIARFILDNPYLPKDQVPYWDFNGPGIPDALRDASAAAITASALLELCRYADKKEGTRFFNAASAILRTLSSPPYITEKGGNGGFVIKHCVGNIPGKSEVDVPLTYADYYFVEAMVRYRALVGSR